VTVPEYFGGFYIGIVPSLAAEGMQRRKRSQDSLFDDPWDLRLAAPRICFEQLGFDLSNHFQ
jgi:hypothetical protein